MDVQNRQVMGSGHGWSGGQIMFWNCNAARMAIQDPPGDEINWAIGCICPDITNVGDATTEPLGFIESQNTHIAAIPSLFIAQLNDRLSLLSNTNYEKDSSIIVYPNPVKTTFVLNLNDGFDDDYKLEMFNTNGQLVINKINFVKLDSKINCEISNLDNGIYFIRIISKKSTKTIKIIVQK